MYGQLNPEVQELFRAVVKQNCPTKILFIQGKLWRMFSDMTLMAEPFLILTSVYICGKGPLKCTKHCRESNLPYQNLILKVGLETEMLTFIANHLGKPSR